MGGKEEKIVELEGGRMESGEMVSDLNQSACLDVYVQYGQAHARGEMIGATT